VPGYSGTLSLALAGLQQRQYRCPWRGLATQFFRASVRSEVSGRATGRAVEKERLWASIDALARWDGMLKIVPASQG